jgi:hypothetical protein
VLKPLTSDELGSERSKESVVIVLGYDFFGLGIVGVNRSKVVGDSGSYTVKTFTMTHSTLSPIPDPTSFVSTSISFM